MAQLPCDVAQAARTLADNKTRADRLARELGDAFQQISQARSELALAGLTVQVAFDDPIAKGAFERFEGVPLWDRAVVERL